ncbi:ankyrin repeat-containing domain protein [Lasiosphaeria ovina]|uniref:Ankyrin repeat-containing domain protein n=1 Tax=Lasiosphaeria ovina TaxID=92902 RepID=A0AAE0JT51_9PEZI|nr:ankyrin repeat-containing domain protein [Lasiosphaeria ovina]
MQDVNAMETLQKSADDASEIRAWKESTVRPGVAQNSVTATSPTPSSETSPAQGKAANSLSMTLKSLWWKRTEKGRRLAAELCQACELTDTEWARSLLEKGAYVNGYDIIKQSSYLSNPRPLEIALERGTTRHLPKTLDLVQLLVHSGAKINTPNGNSLLHLACWNMARSGEILKYLLSQNAKVAEIRPASRISEDRSRDRTFASVSPLHIARGSDANILLQHGADVRALDDIGRTALFWTFSSGFPDLEAMAANISHGSPVNIQDKHGDTPLHSWAKCLALAAPPPQTGFSEATVKNLKKRLDIFHDAAKQLLTSGAHTDIKNNEGKTVIDLVLSSVGKVDWREAAVRKRIDKIGRSLGIDDQLTNSMFPECRSM